jgi:DNA repair protein RecO
MHPFRDLAIILRTVPYQDRHRIITALTESRGQITAIAKNCIQSRRFGGALEPFTASEWIFTLKPGAELYTLTEVNVRRSYEGLRQSFERLSLASVLNELMLKLTPHHEPCVELFRLHSNALAAIEECDKTEFEIPLLNAYLAKLLQWSGSQPRLNVCLQCAQPLEGLPQNEELTCLVNNAGWICQTCRQKETLHIRAREDETIQHLLLRVSVAALKDLQMSLNIPIRQILVHFQANSKQHQELFKFLEALFIYHVPGFDQKPLKSMRFLGFDNPPSRITQ